MYLASTETCTPPRTYACTYLHTLFFYLKRIRNVYCFRWARGSAIYHTSQLLDIQEKYNSQTPLWLRWDNDYISTNSKVEESLLFWQTHFPMPLHVSSRGLITKTSLWENHRLEMSEI